MAEDREIYFYSNTLANSLSLLKVKERVIISDNNFNVGWKDTIGDFHIVAQQKYYDISESLWVYPDNELGKITLNDDIIFNNEFDGLKDQFLISPIPISEDGVVALSTNFTAVSLVGCLNEVRDDFFNSIGTPGYIPKFKVSGLEDSSMWEDTGVIKGAYLNFTGYVKCVGLAARMVIENNTDSSSSGILELNNNRATPSDGDEVGRILLMGNNSAMASKSLCEIVGRALDVTEYIEDGEITLSVTVNGAYNAVYMKINEGFKFYGEDITLGTTSAISNNINIYGNHDQTDDVNHLNFYRSAGTYAAPTPMRYATTPTHLQDDFYNIRAIGWNGSAYQIGSEMAICPTENWTVAAQGTNYQLYVTPDGTTVIKERLRVDGNGVWAIGGDFINQTAGKGAHFWSNTTSAISNTIRMDKSRGDFDTPLKINLNDALGEFDFFGHDGVNYKLGAQIIVGAQENWDTTHNGAQINFYTTKPGAIIQTMNCTMYGDSTYFQQPVAIGYGVVSTGVAYLELNHNSGSHYGFRIKDIASGRGAAQDTWDFSVGLSTRGLLTLSNLGVGNVVEFNTVGQCLFRDGVYDYPSIAPISEPGTGIYFEYPGIIGFSCQDYPSFKFDTSLYIYTTGGGIWFDVDITNLRPIAPYGSDGGLELIAGDGTIGARLQLSTKETSIEANDVLGRINFAAPDEVDGGDANLPGASIVAIAEDTFSATVNKTSLCFQTAQSELASTKMSLNSAGNLGIGAAVAFDSSAVGCLALANAVAPAAHTDNQVYVYSADVTCGTTVATLALYTEHDVRTENISCTKTLPIMINGSPYMLLLGAIPV